MRLKSISTLVVALAAGIAGTTCTSDQPFAPPPPVAPIASASHVLGGLGFPIHVAPLQRITPLEASESVSATVGIFGGYLSLPDAGLAIIVPPFAVSSPTRITVTARAGSDVAYEFAPHGLQFLAPLVAIQDLRSTHARPGGLIDPLSLYVGYFPNSADITTVTELLNVSVDALGQLSVVGLWHFSGYTWSSGRSADADLPVTPP